MNLGNGNYYSLTQSAAVIWESIQQHATLEHIQDRLHMQYSGDTGVMNKDLTDLIQALEAEHLIRCQAASKVGSQDDAPVAEELSAHEREAYQPPLFERFTDMEDLLLLDPVHEAEDDKGWPHAKGSP